MDPIYFYTLSKPGDDSVLLDLSKPRLRLRELERFETGAVSKAVRQVLAVMVDGDDHLDIASRQTVTQEPQYFLQTSYLLIEEEDGGVTLAQCFSTPNVYSLSRVTNLPSTAPITFDRFAPDVRVQYRENDTGYALVDWSPIAEIDFDLLTEQYRVAVRRFQRLVDKNPPNTPWGEVVLKGIGAYGHQFDTVQKSGMSFSPMAVGALLSNPALFTRLAPYFPDGVFTSGTTGVFLPPEVDVAKRSPQRWFDAAERARELILQVDPTTILSSYRGYVDPCQPFTLES